MEDALIKARPTTRRQARPRSLQTSASKPNKFCMFVAARMITRERMLHWKQSHETYNERRGAPQRDLIRQQQDNNTSTIKSNSQITARVVDQKCGAGQGLIRPDPAPGPPRNSLLVGGVVGVGVGFRSLKSLISDRVYVFFPL